MRDAWVTMRCQTRAPTQHEVGVNGRTQRRLIRHARAAFAPTALTVDVTSLATGDEAALRAAAPFVAIRIRGAAPSTALSYDREILLCQAAGEYSWSFPVKTDAED